VTTVPVTATPDGACLCNFEDVDVVVETAYRSRQSPSRGYGDRPAA
jgi:hypothetical protein